MLGRTLVSRKATSLSRGEATRLAQEIAQKNQRGNIDEIKSMSDMEWEQTPLEKKREFVAVMKDHLEQYPADISEQQKRRFYETTQLDPSLSDTTKVQSAYQRIKMGLPVSIQSHRSLGVPQPVYEEADSELFDPNDAEKLEASMKEVKQNFVDYIQRRREGASTELERRVLANLSADLNLRTQSHLAQMFKRAENRLREAATLQRHRQLETANEPPKTSLSKRKLKMKRILRNTFGLDLETVRAFTQQMEEHEKFLQVCEVMTRMTLGAGFVHQQSDEGLSQYTDALRATYSTDASKLANLDLVRYSAALEAVPPVDWATRWFESTLLLPLRQTPEYRRLQGLKEHPTGDEVERKKKYLSDFVSKVFVPPGDTRAAGLRERKIRYLAFANLEAQVQRMRENSREFDGVEHSREADECRSLYVDLQEAKRQVEACGGDPFKDSKVQALFEDICKVVVEYVDMHNAVKKAEKKREKASLFLRSLASKDSSSIVDEVRQINRDRQRSQTSRMLRLLEKDVREDMLWLENAAEAERPPLLPVPEPLSYVSALQVGEWRQLREEYDKNHKNPFSKRGGQSGFTSSFMGQPWQIPDKPLLFWGTGVAAVQQSLQHAANDAKTRRNGQSLAPEYPCPENPYGWRLRRDPLDE